MEISPGLSLDSFVNPVDLEFSDLLVVSLVYTVVLVVLGYAGAVLWQRLRDGSKKKAS